MSVGVFTSYSQAGQDIFVHELIGDHGMFCDIGCGHPKMISNTYGLEQVGWTGLLVDSDENCIKLCKEQRKATCILENAETYNWIHVRGRPDYLSLDCNGSTLRALKNIPDRLSFRVITIETDAYRFGNGPRDEMRSILISKGYLLACPDVKHDGLIFEDWWIDPEMSLKAKFLGYDWL